MKSAGKYRAGLSVVFLRLLVLVVSAKHEATEGTPNPVDGADDLQRQAGSHTYYSTAYSEPRPSHGRAAASGPDHLITGDTSTNSRSHQGTSSPASAAASATLPDLGGVAFTHPTSFEFGQTVNHAVTTGTSSALSPSNTNRDQSSGGALPWAQGNAAQASSRGTHGDLTYAAPEPHTANQGSYYAAATERHQGRYPRGAYGFPQVSRHYNYGSPKGYNTQRAYAYEKVYPEQRYSTNHAVSYDRSYNDDDNYPRRGHGSSSSGYRYPGGSGDYSSGGSGYGPSRGGYESRYDSRPAATSGGRDDGKPRMRSYVYKDPYDKSTMRVVEMSSGYPGSSSTLSKTFSKLGGMENFVASLMKNAREAYPY